LELDARIDRYRRLSASILDQETIDRIEALIDQLRAEKAKLHPKNEQGQRQ
jgi:hypothetical protein